MHQCGCSIARAMSATYAGSYIWLSHIPHLQAEAYRNIAREVWKRLPVNFDPMKPR